MTELLEAVARGLRKKCAEIENRPGVISPDAMWFSDEYAQAALTAIESAGYRIVKDEPTPGMINRGVDFAIKAKLGGDYMWPDYIKELFCTMIAAAPGDEK